MNNRSGWVAGVLAVGLAFFCLSPASANSRCGGNGQKVCKPHQNWGYLCDRNFADVNGVCRPCGRRDQVACARSRRGPTCVGDLKRVKGFCRGSGTDGVIVNNARVRPRADSVFATETSLALYFRDEGKTYYYRLTEKGLQEAGGPVQESPGYTHVLSDGLRYNANSGLLELRHSNDGKTYPNFGAGYDIVAETFNRGRLFYDRETGSARHYTEDRDYIGFTQNYDARLGAPDYTTSGWHKGWDIIQTMPGAGVSGKKLAPLLFYDRDTGAASLYDFLPSDRSGMRLLWRTDTWRKTWKIILPYRTSSREGFGAHVDTINRDLDTARMVLFYDNVAGEGSFYEWDRQNGKVGKLVERKNGWRKTWDNIFAIRIAEDASQRYMVFHDNDTGDVNVYEIENDGKFGKRIQ